MCTNAKLMIIMYRKAAPQQQYSKRRESTQDVLYQHCNCNDHNTTYLQAPKVHKMCTNIAIAKLGYILAAIVRAIYKYLQPSGYGKSLACSGVSDIFILYIY